MKNVRTGGRASPRFACVFFVRVALPASSQRGNSRYLPMQYWDRCLLLWGRKRREVVAWRGAARRICRSRGLLVSVVSEAGRLLSLALPCFLCRRHAVATRPKTKRPKPPSNPESCAPPRAVRANAMMPCLNSPRSQPKPLFQKPFPTMVVAPSETAKPTLILKVTSKHNQAIKQHV